MRRELAVNALRIGIAWVFILLVCGHSEAQRVLFPPGTVRPIETKTLPAGPLGVGKFTKVIDHKDAIPGHIELGWDKWQFEAEYYIGTQQPSEQTIQMYVPIYNPHFFGAQFPRTTVPDVRVLVSFHQQEDPFPGFVMDGGESGEIVLNQTPPSQNLDVQGAQEPAVAQEFAFGLLSSSPAIAHNIMDEITADVNCPAIVQGLQNCENAGDPYLALHARCVLAHLGVDDVLKSLTADLSANPDLFSGGYHIVDMDRQLGITIGMIGFSPVAWYCDAIGHSSSDEKQNASGEISALLANSATPYGVRSYVLNGIGRVTGLRPVLLKLIEDPDDRIATRAMQALYYNTAALSDFGAGRSKYCPPGPEQFKANRQTYIDNWKEYERTHGK